MLPKDVSGDGNEGTNPPTPEPPPTEPEINPNLTEAACQEKINGWIDSGNFYCLAGKSETSWRVSNSNASPTLCEQNLVSVKERNPNMVYSAQCYKN